MATIWPSLEGTACGVHVVPPSVVAMTVLPLASRPAAKQVVAVGQLTSIKDPVPTGSVTAAQVAPPLVVL